MESTPAMSKLVKQVQRKLISIVPPHRRLRLTHTVAKFIPAPRTPVGSPARLPYQHKELALAAVRGALEAAGVDYFRVPARRPFASQIGVTDAEALAPLMRRVRGEGLAVECRKGVWTAWSGSRDYACTVSLWRPSGDELVTDEPNAMTQRVRADQPVVTRPEATFGPYADFGDASAWPTRAEFTETPAQRVDFPIDVVYTWVDGADPAWRARRDTALRKRGEGHHALASNESRYTDHGELRYSMRSLWSYAPWFRRVYLVTDDQVPDWLDTGHPRLRIVSHKELFGDRGRLPTFNSHAIESQLHHVPGLADQYLYFNDDMFFGRPVEPELFFTGNGMARFFLGEQVLDLDVGARRDLPATAAAKKNRELIERDFGVTVRYKYRHGVYPQLREVLAELELRHPDDFARVAASRFRHPDDLSIPSSLSHSYAYLRGRAVEGTMHYRYQDIGRANTARRLDEILRERPQVFCLNDIATDPDQVPKVDALLQSFFAEYFPLRSPFECD